MSNKITKSDISSNYVSEESVSSSEKVKKRGRPRKEKVESEIQKRRGRPPKEKSESETSSEGSQKRCGRPRLNLTEEEKQEKARILNRDQYYKKKAKGTAYTERDRLRHKKLYEDKKMQPENIEHYVEIKKKKLENLIKKIEYVEKNKKLLENMIDTVNHVEKVRKSIDTMAN